MNYEGYLIVFVTTASQTIPISQAKVRITRRNGAGQSELLSYQLTDDNGKTELVSISAPAAELSQTPGNLNPFAVCDIVVEKDGFITGAINNVQIFSGITSVQQIGLIPRPEYSDYTRDTIDVIPQNL